MKALRTSAVAAAVVLGTWGGAQASTIDVLFDLRGDAGLVESLSFSEGGLNLTVTGHLLNGNGTVGSQERVGQYSNGLGVTNDNETKTVYEKVCTGEGRDKRCEKTKSVVYTDAHFLDGRGENEVLKFAFDKMVQIHKVWFSYNDRNDEFAFTVLDGEQVGTYYPSIDIEGKKFYSSYTFSKEWIASLFGIGAVGNNDQFKVKKIHVSYHEPVNEIPLPAAGWMLLAGLGGLAALRRKRAA